MATSRRGPAGETGQETDQPADQQPEPTSDVQRAQQAGDATRTTDKEWPATRENGNPFDYGRVKRPEDTQPAEGDEA